jgi:hypothetical protein
MIKCVVDSLVFFCPFEMDMPSSEAIGSRCPDQLVKSLIAEECLYHSRAGVTPVFVCSLPPFRQGDVRTGSTVDGVKRMDVERAILLFLDLIIRILFLCTLYLSCRSSCLTYHLEYRPPNFFVSPLLWLDCVGVHHRRKHELESRQ